MDTELQVVLSDFNGEQVQAVSARTLYEFLRMSKKHFASWLVQSIVNNEYAVENEDYIIMSEGSGVKDCVLTIDFAKRLAMKSGGSKGEEVRAYFLKVEKAYKVKIQKPLTQLEIVVQSAQILGEQSKKLEEHDQRLLQLEAHNKTSEFDFYTVSGYCSLKGFKHISLSEASILGRRCTKMSEELEYDVKKIYDPRWGTVNAYHIDILSQIVK